MRRDPNKARRKKPKPQVKERMQYPEEAELFIESGVMYLVADVGNDSISDCPYGVAYTITGSHHSLL